MKFNIKIKNVKASTGDLSVTTFYLQLVPKWFEWSGWTLILGVVYYFAIQSKSAYLGTIAGLSQAFIWAYFIVFFWRIEFRGGSFLKTRNQERAFLILIALFLSFIAWYVMMIVAFQIGALTKG